MDDDFLRLFGTPDQPPQAQSQEDDPFSRLFGPPPPPPEEQAAPPEDENVFQRIFGALTQPQAVEEQPDLPAMAHGFPTSAGAEQAAAAGGTIPLPGGLEGGQVGGVLPGMAEQFVDPGTPEVSIGEPTAVPQPQEGPTPMGARMEASKQKAMETLLADDARIRQVFRQELVDAGITDEEGQLAWTKAFMLGAQGSALPTLAQKAIEAVGGDPQKGYDLVRRLVEEGTVEPRAGVEMLGMMSAILADVAITRGIAGAIPGTSAARTAAQAVAGKRKVGIAEGILEGIGADAVRAIQREDEGALDVLIGAGLGGAFGAALPGKAVSDEALEGIRATLKQAGPDAAARQVAEAQGKQAAQGTFNEVVFRTADGEIIGKGMGAQSHPELMFALTPDEAAKIADQGFADEFGNFKPGRGTPDAPIFDEAAEQAGSAADVGPRQLPPAEEPKLLAPPQPEGGRQAVRQPPVPEEEPFIRGMPEQTPAPPSRQIPERTGTIITPPPRTQADDIAFARKEADRLRAEKRAAEAPAPEAPAPEAPAPEVPAKTRAEEAFESGEGIGTVKATLAQRRVLKLLGEDHRALKDMTPEDALAMRDRIADKGPGLSNKDRDVLGRLDDKLRAHHEAVGIDMADELAKRERVRLDEKKAILDEADELPLVEGTEQFAKSKGDPFGFTLKPDPKKAATIEVAGRYNPDTGVVTVGNVQGGKGLFGTKGVRQAFKEIRRLFPDAKRIEGLRTTEGGITQGKKVSREIRPASNTPTVTPEDVPSMRKASDDPQIDLFNETISNKEGGFVPSFVLREVGTPIAGAVIGGTAGSLLGTPLPGTTKKDRFISGAIAGAVLPLSWKGIKLLASSTPRGRRLLTPGGELAGAAKTFGDEALTDVRRLIAGLTGQAAEADRIISQAAGDLFAVTKKLYGTKGRAMGVISGESPFAAMPDKVREAAGKFFSGDQAAIADVPQEMRIHLARMRGQIDRFSRAFVSEGIVEGELAIKFHDELGIYLTRSYRVFDDPDWVTNAPKVLGEQEWDKIVNDFKVWFRDAYEDPKAGKFISDDELDVIYRDFLAHGDDGSNAMKYIQSGRLGKLNMKTLAGRKDIPIEVRRLWGEHEDPWINYVRSLTNQGTYLANHRFLRELRDAGLKSNFLWDDAQGIRPKGMGDLTAQFTETKGPLGPLAGTRTTPEFKAALIEQFKNESIPTMFKVVLYPNSVSKIAKTVLSPVTHIRNLGANVMFTAMNGHNPLVTGKNLKSSFKDVMIAAGWKAGTESERDFVNKLVRLGVIDDNANAQELTEAIKHFQGGTVKDFLDKPHLGKLPRGVRNIFNASVGAYRAEDDVWKIIAFKAEKERYLKAGLKGDELDQAAATIVRRTWPTFSMTPEAVNQFRRIGGFISFPSEVWRASYGTLKQIEEELASSNKAIRTIGAKRAAGAFFAITAGLGAAKATRAMYNISREEEDAIRTLSPPWNEHGSYIYAGRPKDGKYKYYDASNFLPHSYITDAFNAMMRGEEWEETMFAVGASAIGPFVGGSPLASELLKGYVKSERAADFEHPMWKAAAKGITPGVYDQVLRVATGRTSGLRPVERDTEIKAIVSGMRAVDRDAVEDLSFLASGFNSRMTQQKGPLRRADVFGITSRVIGQIMPEKSMAALEEKTREAQLNVLAEMAQHTRAAMLVGVNESKVRAILKDKGISRANLEIIMTAAYAGVRR